VGFVWAVTYWVISFVDDAIEHLRSASTPDKGGE
jgi:hypothetical protein